MSDQPQPRLDRRVRVIDRGKGEKIVKSNTPDAVAERKRMALAHYEKGLTIAEIAQLLDLSDRAIYKWQTSDPVFKDEMARIREERDMELSEEFEELAINIARGGEGVTKDGLPNYTAVRDVLKVTNRNRWGDKKEVSHSGTVVHTLIPTARRLDELTTGDVIDVPVGAGDEESDE